MDREIEMKTEQKYSLDDENEIVEWIISVLLHGQNKDLDDLHNCNFPIPEYQGKKVNFWLRLHFTLMSLYNLITSFLVLGLL